jgi:hypothetical protein
MTTRILIFDGNAAKFASWWKRFLAYATMSGFKDILKEERDKNLPEEEVSSEDNTLTKEEARAVIKNDTAITSFSLAFNTNKAMQILYVDCTKG